MHDEQELACLAGRSGLQMMVGSRPSSGGACCDIALAESSSPGPVGPATSAHPSKDPNRLQVGSYVVCPAMSGPRVCGLVIEGRRTWTWLASEVVATGNMPEMSTE